MNLEAILGLISDLYSQVTGLQSENNELIKENEQLKAALKEADSKE